MIWKLFEGDVPDVSTHEFHKHRDRARHLEEGHRPRLDRAANFVRSAARLGALSASDLGCGDGGLLSLISDDVECWGYDFQPSNADGWSERGVKAEALDVFGADRERVRLGDVVVMTEVLEHIADPQEVLRWVYASGPRWLVASSPWDETPEAHDECHAWCFDWAGYRDLVSHAGWRILRHDRVDRFQVIFGTKL